MRATSQLINVMVIGAQKSGTSSLMRYIAQHPSIRTHRSAEFGYFVNDRKYMQGYEAAFRSAFGPVYSGPKVVLGKSVSVLPSYEALRRVYQHNPEMKKH